MIRVFFIAATAFLFVSASNTPEQQQFHRGLLWEDNRYNALPVTYSTAVLHPPAKSLKAFYPKVVLEPRQDFTGVSWAAIWNARTAAEAIACNQTNPAEILKFSFSPAYNYALIRKGDDCKEAISLLDLLESMRTNGTPYFSEFREFCAATVSPEFYPVAKSKRLSGSLKLFNTSDSKEVKVQSVKQALVNNHAVIVGIICPPSFQLAQEFWQPREEPDVQYGGHALSVVGYDDTKFGGAFEIVNTWGKDWGLGGFTWLRYKDFADFGRYGFSLFQVGSAACNSPLEGSVSFHLAATREELKTTSEGVDGEYKIVKSLSTGTELTITATSNRPAYFYSYFIDAEHGTFQAFPMKENTQAILFDVVKIPEGADNIQLTEPAGLNQLYFVFSPEKVNPQSFAEGHRGTTATFNSGVTWMKDSPRFSSTMRTPVVIKVYLDQKKN